MAELLLLTFITFLSIFTLDYPPRLYQEFFLKCEPVDFFIGENLSNRINYSKSPLKYEEQADLLVSRGLIADKNQLIEGHYTSP
jgi:hypothetical protein